jgi:hypothetical protein
VEPWLYSPCHLQNLAKSSLSKVSEFNLLCLSHYSNQIGLGWTCMSDIQILGRSKSDQCRYLQGLSSCFPPSCCTDFGTSFGLAWPPEEVLDRSGLTWTMVGSEAPAYGIRELQNSQLAATLLIRQVAEGGGERVRCCTSGLYLSICSRPMRVPCVP